MYTLESKIKDMLASLVTRPATRISAFLKTAIAVIGLAISGCGSPQPIKPTQTTNFVADSLIPKFERVNNLDYADFPIGKPVDVSFDFSEVLSSELSPRERIDQARDWLFLTILSNVGLSEVELNYFTYDLAPIRYGILDPIVNREFGSRRSIYLGKGEVVGLIHLGTDLEMDDEIGHILDRHRKDIGAIPDSISLFAYELNPAACYGSIRRIGTFNSKPYFTEAKGYFENEVHFTKGLSEFLAKTHDLTYAAVDGSKLIVGGRKLLSHGYQNISLEDVAAIWQSEAVLTNYERKVARLEKKIDEYNSRAEAYNQGLQSHKGRTVEDILRESGREPSLEDAIRDIQTKRNPQTPEEILRNLKDGKLRQAFDTDESRFSFSSSMSREADELDRLAKEIGQEQKNLELESVKMQQYGSAGFSLDPAYDYGALTEYFQSEHDLLSKMGSESQLLSIESALLEKNEIPLLQFVDDIQNKGTLLQQFGIAIFADSLQRGFRYQQARYDGNLEGTTIGLHLFYTDLLAKIWAIDYLKSSPRYNINEFVSVGSSEQSEIYSTEASAFPSARIWFGPNSLGFQKMEGGKNEIVFARNATQIYAASSNPLEPGKEVPVSAHFEPALKWWNNHYEEVAEFEPEYQVLNEIMKWSLVIAWLNSSENSVNIAGIQDVSVRHDQCFWSWAKAKKDLKFSDWNSFGSDCRGHLGAATETMDILFANYENANASGTLSGGVSLADRNIIKSIRGLDSKIGNNFARSNLDYALSTEGRLVTQKQCAIEFGEMNGKNATRMSPPAEFKLRNRQSEFTSQPFHRTVSHTTEETRIGVGIDNAETAAISIKKSQGSFAVAATSREMDEGIQLGKRLSGKQDIEKVFENERRLVSSQKLDGDGEYLLEFDDHYLQIKVQNKPDVEIGKVWDVRTAAVGAHSKTVNLKWLDKKSGLEIAKSSKHPIVPRNTNRIRGALQGDEDAIAKLEKLCGKREYSRGEEYLEQLLKTSKFTSEDGKGITTLIDANRSLTNNRNNSALNYATANGRNLVMQTIDENLKSLRSSGAFNSTWRMSSNYPGSILRISGMENTGLLSVDFPLALRQLESDQAILFIQNHELLDNAVFSNNIARTIEHLTERYPNLALMEVPNDILGGIKFWLVPAEMRARLGQKTEFDNQLHWEAIKLDETIPSSSQPPMGPGNISGNPQKPVYYLFLSGSPCS